MIFATVGTQLPFDRLIRGLDKWAAANNSVEVYAQIGRGQYEPQHIAWIRDMTPQDFRRRVSECSTVVAHAGMGSIISGLELGKRVIVMPRLASLGEHRNEHQLATVARLEHLNGFEVAHDSGALAEALDRQDVNIEVAAPLAADPALIGAVRSFSGLVSA
ncbi:MAG: glycosyltransferase [Halieaceae bacterium]